MPNRLNQAGNYANYVFTIYFLVEMIIKMIGMGFKRYMRDRMNIFDAGACLSVWHGSQGCMYMQMRACVHGSEARGACICMRACVHGSEAGGACICIL